MSTLCAAISERDITPPIGEPLAGYIHRMPESTGLLDGLTLQALALRSDDTSAMVIVTDSVGTDASATSALRERVSAATGIPESHIVWHCVHTHASPSFHKYRGMAQASDEYLATVLDAAEEAAGRAFASAKPVELTWGLASAAGLNRNRRSEGGPMDDEATQLLLQPDGSTGIRVVGWQCHPVCLGGENRSISGDYVGAFRRRMSDLADETPMYLNGCCGDLNPVGRGPEGALKTGGELAERVARMDALRPIASTPVRVATRMVSLPQDHQVDMVKIGAYLTSERERMKALTDPLAQRECGAMIEWAYDLLSAARANALPDSPEVEITAIRMGDAAMVFLPAEVLCMIGLELKRRSPLPVTIPVSCTGAVAGYVGMPEEFEHGGYELDIASRYYGLLPFLPEAGRVLLDGAVEAVSGTVS